MAAWSYCQPPPPLDPRMFSSLLLLIAESISVFQHKLQIFVFEMAAVRLKVGWRFIMLGIGEQYAMTDLTRMRQL